MRVSPSGTAANIVIRARPTDQHVSLRRMLDVCGSNQNDRAIVFIEACISDGVNTRAEIIALGKQLGLNPAHLAIVLNHEAGNSSARHRWRRDEHGLYSLLI
jgi:hypothetical protein